MNLHSQFLGGERVTTSCAACCLYQARQDILAQDLAEAIDSQVELAEQLRCYREENEKLLRENQGVSVFVSSGLGRKEHIDDEKNYIDCFTAT